MPRARRSTRSGVCSDWATRAVRRSSAPPRARSATTSGSRGPGWATPTTCRSPGSRPPPGGSSPRPAPPRAWRPTTPPRRCPRRRPPSSPGGSRTRSSTCSRRRRPAPRARSAPARSCSAAGWPPTASCAGGWPTRPPRLGIPLIVPRPGLCTDNGAMIGAAGVRRFLAGDRSGLDLDARPSLPLAVR